tara:strand:- start:27627 stop:28262 length:636 start_codon:yes stop_codon:yes gene_type:complete
MKLKIKEVKLNENNPRVIKDNRFNQLVQSITDFPQMMELRPIVVDEDKMILGGNMRFRACNVLKWKEVPVLIYTRELHETAMSKRPIELQVSYEAGCDEFTIKDNVPFGEWEWDMLANNYNTKELKVWGIDVWQNMDDIETYDEFNLPEGDKGNLEQITYTLSSEQSKEIKRAVQDIKTTEGYKFVETFGNENSNGNALYLLIMEWKKTNS